MSKYNSKAKSSTATINRAGGEAFKQSTKLEICSLLVTAYMAGDKYYETESQLIDRLEKLYSTCKEEDKQFFAKASIYARDKFRLRSISHLCSAILAEDVVKDGYTREDKKWIESYFAKVIFRMDDITETISAYKARPDAYKNSKGRVQLPFVMKRGFSRAMANRDEYQFAKYRCEGKDTTLIDAVRMVHAKATESNKVALEKLVNGTLRNSTTWETKQSEAGKAGSTATSEKEKVEAVQKAKSEAWSEFVGKGKKVEYLALLRNLRNIYQEADEATFNKACDLLIDPDLVTKAGTLPFQYLVAYNELSGKDRKLQQTLSKAIDLSLSNVPKFSGKTAILVDISGSMSSRVSSVKGASVRCCDLAGLFASALYKNNNADVVMFDDDAEWFKGNPDDSTVTLAKQIGKASGCTDMSVAFKALTKKYDRIIILSDMQSWLDGSSKRNNWYGSDSYANDSFNAYRKKYNPECKLYTFDLTGYGDMKFPERNVFTIAGLSNATFDVMSKMEEDRSYMVHEIESIVL